MSTISNDQAWLTLVINLFVVILGTKLAASRIEDLQAEHNFVPEDLGFGFDQWAFVEDLLAPGVAMKYDGLTLR